MNSINAENYNLILDKKYKKLITLKNNIMGYPENQNFSYANLNKFYDLSLNNVGDSFIPSNYPLNSHEFEADVIRYIANLYNKYQNYWGYITNGGTEGNLVALHVARKMYPEGIVYYSEQSHYSILKAIEVTRSNSICIPVLKNGEINYELFAHRISENKNLPAIIMLNLGTTMTGAIDDIEKIKYVLHHYKIKKHYLHCDAALHGLILPFCSLNKPIILDDFHSISISGHKFIGSPLPCGVFVTHQKYINRIKRNVDYIKSSD